MLFYSEAEIRRQYRQAKDKKAQIRILADLNVCSVRTIKAILGIEQKPPTTESPIDAPKSSNEIREAPVINIGVFI